MLDLIKNMFKIVSARIQLFEQFYINYIIIALLSVALVCACVLIQYKITKYKKQTHLKVLVCNLINIICLYSSVLLFSYLTQLIPDFEICSDNMLLDSYIITLCIIWFYGWRFRTEIEVTAFFVHGFFWGHAFFILEAKRWNGRKNRW